jgi:cysteine desulfurase
MVHTMTTAFGNANSVEHSYGEVAAALVAAARREVAALVHTEPEGVHFTSGSTESIRLALAYAVAGRGQRPLRVAVTTVEHRAVLDAIAIYERRGEVTVRWLPVDGRARLDMAVVETACRDGLDLVCVMAANNEVGTLYPVEEIARMAGHAGARTLIDATQAAGRVPIQAAAWDLTYLAVSAHKMYGPKGVGALIVPPALDVRPSHGSTPGIGDGTPNVPGIVGLGEACRLRRLEMADDEPRIAAQRDRLEGLLLAGITGLVINGDRACRLSHNLHVSVPDVPNDAVIARLRHRVALSTGAACSSGAHTPSHVLRAMGVSEAIQDGALRMGLGKYTTDDDIARAAAHIVQTVATLRHTMGRRGA